MYHLIVTGIDSKHNLSNVFTWAEKRVLITSLFGDVECVD